MRPKWVVSQPEKSYKALKKNFRKKNSSSLFVQTWSKRCRNFLKINRSWDIKVSLILRFHKIVLHNKINKTRSKKNKENSAQRFGINYLKNHLVKFLQAGITPLELIEYVLVINFLKKIVSEGFLTSFNFWRGSC